MHSEEPSLQQLTIEYFRRELAKKNPQDVESCRNIVDSIIDDIMQQYTSSDLPSKKQVGFWEVVFQKKQQAMQMQLETLDKLLGEKLLNTISYNDQKLLHVEVYKQFVPNLCGYHASYNLIVSIMALKSGDIKEIWSGGAFWTYVHKIQSFLRHYADRTRQDRTKWPWSDEEIFKGDFERTYWKVCQQHNPTIKSLISDEQIGNRKLIIRLSTVFFQYGNFIFNSNDERAEIEKCVSGFKKFKPLPGDQYVLGLMLGITNHWVSMLAVKENTGIKFYLFDSRNRDFLNWTEPEIIKFLDEENIRRVEKGLAQWANYMRDIYQQGMKDIQLCLKVLIEILSGDLTITAFTANSRLRTFIDPLTKLLDAPQSNLIKFQFSDTKFEEEYAKILAWAEEWFFTIRAYARMEIEGLTQENRILVWKLSEMINYCNQQPQSAGNRRIPLINDWLKKIVKIAWE